MTDITTDSAAQRLGRGCVYLLGGLPLGVASFVVAIAGFAAGAGTLVVGAGLLILTGTLWAARGFAELERRATRQATGRDLPPHHYRPTRGRGIRRWISALADPQSWRDLLHAVVAFPIRLAGFVIAVGWGAGGLGGTLCVLWEWSLPRVPGDHHGLYWLITGSDARLGDIAFTSAAGAVLLVTLPWVIQALVALQAGFARGLLTNQTAALRARTEQLAASRRAAVQAEAHTLRRVERDLHDGPQQRLVRLNMDLEAASRRLDDDPDQARPLVAEALEQSREALSELRALSRGIAPPILADRGLGPALTAAAARCPVQVCLEVNLPGDQRLAGDVENTAYFVVTEALTNVAKHSGAARCTVTVGADDRQVLVQVSDDGHGGAHLGKGHGLSGLADRLATMEGVLDVVSPSGGPTVLTAEIPLIGVRG